MKINSKSLPALALAFLFLLALSAMAQTKADTSINTARVVSDVSTVNPLALTDAEKADLANLLSRYNQADQILAARLRVVLEIECDTCEQDYAVKLGIDDARKFYREAVKPAQAAYLKRLEEIQQAHDCLGCAIGKDGALVKPEKK